MDLVYIFYIIKAYVCVPHAIKWFVLKKDVFHNYNYYWYLKLIRVGEAVVNVERGGWKYLSRIFSDGTSTQNREIEALRCCKERQIAHLTSGLPDAG